MSSLPSATQPALPAAQAPAVLTSALPASTSAAQPAAVEHALEYLAIDASERLAAVVTSGQHGVPTALVVEGGNCCLTIATRAFPGGLRFTRHSLPRTYRPHLELLSRVAPECARLLWETAAAASEAGAGSSAEQQHSSSLATQPGSWALGLCERLLHSQASAPSPAAGLLHWAADSSALCASVLQCWELGSHPLLPGTAAAAARPPAPSASLFPLPPTTSCAARHPTPAVLLLTPAYLAMQVDPEGGREAVGFSWDLQGGSASDSDSASASASPASLTLFPFAASPSQGSVTWMRCPPSDPRAARVAALLARTACLPLLARTPRGANAGGLDAAMGQGPHTAAVGALLHSQGGGGLLQGARAALHLCSLGEQAAAAARVGEAAWGGAGSRVLPVAWTEGQEEGSSWGGGGSSSSTAEEGSLYSTVAGESSVQDLGM